MGRTTKVGRIMVRWAAAAGVLLLVILGADPAHACSCVSSSPPCQNYFQVDAVFAGTVRSIVDLERTPATPYGGRSVTFTVERAFRGLEGVSVRVNTGMGGGDCGYEFKEGEHYLVYASRDEHGHLRTGICSRTRTLADAAEDLRFIEGLKDAGTGARVYGVLTHWERDLATGNSTNYGAVPFVHVQLRGASATVDVQTDEQGRYMFGGVPPGAYEVQVIPPPMFSSKYLAARVDVRDPRGCAVADFGVRYDGRIHGVVLSADGQPAAGVRVQVMPAGKVGASGNFQVLTGQANGGGYFEFSEVSPGLYVVGVTLQRAMEADVVYPRTFYPGTSDPADAATVEVGQGNLVTLQPFKLPPPRQRLQLGGVVSWPDGTPVPGAFVSLWDGEATWRQVATGIQTGADGRFSFLVHEGLNYVARASHNIPDDPRHRQVQATAGPFVVSSATAMLRLVLVPPVDR